MNINNNLDNIRNFINTINDEKIKTKCSYLLNKLSKNINKYTIENNINEDVDIDTNILNENKDENNKEKKDENNKEKKDENKLKDTKNKLSFIEERINDINNKFILYMQNKEQIEQIMNDFYFQISNNNLLENLSSIYNIQDEQK
tara:strand:- start:45 stop:479 length:435 start_codon:yes stop_codon:yes gene_type:complete